jgi:hypothetical protein
MALNFTTSYLEDSLALFRQSKGLADGAMAQVSDAQFFLPLGEEENSIAIVVKHMAGNLRSRWTNFLTTDGEKPSRDRDGEFENPVFEDPAAARAALVAEWEEGWALLFAALEPLSASDLARTVRIRGEAHSVMQAISRAYGHCAYHVGQIVLLAKHSAGARWQTLTIPRKQSAEFNRRVAAGEASQR